MTPARARKLLGSSIVVAILGLIVGALWPRPGADSLERGATAGPEPLGPATQAELEPGAPEASMVAEADKRSSLTVSAGRPEEARLVGTVRDTHGQPIDGAWVNARFALTRGSNSGLCASGRDGIWSLDHLEPGSLLLQVEARAGGFRGARLRPRAKVAAGTNPLIDVVLTEAPGFRGRVLDARSNRPLVEASVSIVDGERRWPASQAPTDADGRFALAGGLAAQAEVMVEKQGYAYVRATWNASDAERIVLLQPADAALSGVLLDTEGIPAPNSFMYLRTAAGAFALANTDESGRFRFEHFPAGPAHVFGFSARKGPGRATSVLKELEIESGENVVHLQLEKPAAARICGFVRRDRAPLGWARIYVAQRAPRQIFPGNLDSWVLYTREDGRFDLGDLIPAHYEVQFESLDGSAGQPAQYEFDLAAGETSRELEFESVPGAYFQGRVRAAYPEGSLALELWKPDGTAPVARTEILGGVQDFYFEHPVPPARYRLRLLDRGDLLTEVDVGPDSDRHIELLPAH